MRYLKRFNEENDNIDLKYKFSEISGYMFKTLRCEKLEKESGYLLEYSGNYIADIILSEDNIKLKYKDNIDIYTFDLSGVSKLLIKLTYLVNNIRSENSLILRKSEILKKVIETDIPDDIILNEFGQLDKSTLISFIEKGKPSESYLKRVSDLIEKYS